MRIVIRTRAVFELPLTLEQIVALITLSEHHYDARCKMAGHGFLAGWRGQIKVAIECDIPDVAVGASFDELDTCLKLLEMRFSLQHLVDRAVTDALHRHFMGATRLANDKFNEWQTVYEGDDG